MMAGRPSIRSVRCGRSKPLPRHVVRVTADRDNPGGYFVIAEFPSYEEAMKNSELPETKEFAAKQQELSYGPRTFHNLDVLEVQEG
jgi:hypothetical protein